MKKGLIISMMICCLLILMAQTGPADRSIGVISATTYFKREAILFSRSADQLVNAIRVMDSHQLARPRAELKNCRFHYKRIEFFLEYFFRNAAMLYNSPPKPEVEEPFMEFSEPMGFQRMEAILFDKDLPSQKAILLQQAIAIRESAADLGSLLYDFEADDRQMLESLRINLIRIMTLNITGFDAPFLKTGIQESGEAISSIQYVLQPYLRRKTRFGDSVTYYAQKAYKACEETKDFDSFDRLSFLTIAALPLQHYLGLFIKEQQLELNTTSVLNYEAKNLFSPDALCLNAFPGTIQGQDSSLIQLGKKLFFEKALSGNYSRSCASCHKPEKYFTDNLEKSIAYDNRSSLTRNAPSLLYAGFQFAQSWDGKAHSLEEQINRVMHKPSEMNATDLTVLKRLEATEDYKYMFQKAFRPNKKAAITIEQVIASLASYLRSLAPRNSAFDHYILGNQKALTQSQVKGFNLFSGKAQCATCHFPPLFNGLRPPFYNLTDYEVLGITATEDLAHPVEDNDDGRFSVMPISFYRGAFKTPTVRNSAMTGPYMHHGTFRSLEKVISFYNQGGGAGLGMNIPGQTLSAIPLQLTDADQKDLLHFLQALTDSLSF